DTPGAVTRALDAAVAQDAIKNSRLKQALARYGKPADFVCDLDNRISHAIHTGDIPVLDSAVAELACTATFIKQQGKAKKACAEAFQSIEALPTLIELVPLARNALIDSAVAAVRRRAAAHKLAHRQYSYNDLIQALHEALS